MPRAFYDKVWRTTSHLLFFRIIYKHTSKNNSVSKAVFSLHYDIINGYHFASFIEGWPNTK